MLAKSDSNGEFNIAPDSDNLTVALAVAKAGLPVFPASVTFNKTKNRWDKKPRITGWQNNASTDEKQLREWWRAWPDAVPGIELGRAGLVMIDTDRHGRDDGVANFAVLVAQHGPLPDHPIATTAGGGEHHYFKQPSGEPFGNTEGALHGKEINVRGKGGWAVAPGAVRPDGKRWGPAGLTKAHHDNAIPILPDWIAELIRSAQRANEKAESKPNKQTKERMTEQRERQPWSAAEEARVRAALQTIPSDDRTTWFEIGAALHWTGWERARAIWDAWSKTTPGAFDAGDQQKTWRDFDRPYTGKPKTLASLFHLAQANGWTNDNAATEGRPEPPWLDAASNAPPPAAMPILKLDDWLKRDLAEPDLLLGHLLSTTSRAIINAPTGIGKTMFGMGMFMGMSAGLGFLRWGSVRPARTLFIDGEMSRRLLKQRLADEAKRLGVVPENMHVLSREDVETFPPLNTPAGQIIIERVIQHLGGIDIIAFDNVMSLIGGDMKDEETWRQTLPWVLSLTRRSIGQLWIHHTGHDQSRGYGTSTREWQMSLVGHLEKIERPDTDVSFLLKFPKARERTPANRADFADLKVALVNDQWTSEATDGVRKVSVSPLTTKFYDALVNATIGNGAAKMYGCPAATIEEWRAECFKAGLLDRDKLHSARTLFSKSKRELIAANQIACNETMAWTLPN
jgi:hypothetical protein